MAPQYDTPIENIPIVSSPFCRSTRSMFLDTRFLGYRFSPTLRASLLVNAALSAPVGRLDQRHQACACRSIFPSPAQGE